MIAYLTKTSNGFTLRICLRPCNGAEYAASECVTVASKRDARRYCNLRGITPWNF